MELRGHLNFEMHPDRLSNMYRKHPVVQCKMIRLPLDPLRVVKLIGVAAYDVLNAIFSVSKGHHGLTLKYLLIKDSFTSTCKLLM